MEKTRFPRSFGGNLGSAHLLSTHVPIGKLVQCTCLDDRGGTLNIFGHQKKSLFFFSIKILAVAWKSLFDFHVISRKNNNKQSPTHRGALYVDLQSSLLLVMC